MRTMAIILGIVGLLPLMAEAQVNPAFYPGAALYAPQIDVVNSGINFNVGATVSHDRKYVTITATPQQSQLVRMQTFTFQSAGGMVGGGAQNGAAAGGAGGGAAGAKAASVAVLDQTGMVRLADP